MRPRPEVRWLLAGHRRARRAAAKLRASARGSRLRAEIGRFLALWHAEIAPHFAFEEEVLLPELALRLSEGDALVVVPITEHLLLRGLVREIGRATGDRPRHLARQLADKLQDHFGFEETVLFPALVEQLGRARLMELCAELRSRNRPSAR